MPKYRVDVHKTYGTCVVVEADSPEQAEEIVDKYFDSIPVTEFEDTCYNQIETYEKINKKAFYAYDSFIKMNKDGVL